MAQNAPFAQNPFGFNPPAQNPSGPVNSRPVIEPNWAAVQFPDNIMQKKYKSKFKQYAQGTPVHVKAPIGKRGKRHCPTNTDGTKWKAYEYPIPDYDVKLGQQWSIKRKNYLGVETDLFCYPEGIFAGQKYDPVTDPENPAIDLDLFEFTSPGDVSDSLKTLVDIMMPNNSIKNLERERIETTQRIIKFQRSALVKKEKETAIDTLQKKLKSTTPFVGLLSKSLKEKKTRKEAKTLVEIVHQVAIANIGLLSSDAQVNRQAEGECNTYNGLIQPNIRGINACVPDWKHIIVPVGELEYNTMEKEELKEFLSTYAEKIVALKESLEDKDYTRRFYSLTKQQKELSNAFIPRSQPMGVIV